MALEKVRETIFKRCEGYCEKCGFPLFESWAIHHRKLKSRGGDDSASNLIALHHACHNLATDSVHNQPLESKETGRMVSTWEEPEKVPLKLPNGRKVFLTTDGKYQTKENK